MNPARRDTSTLVAQGWILMFLVLVCIFVTELAHSVVSGDPALRDQEARAGVRVVTMLMLLHAAVPTLVSVCHARWFRWTVAVLTGVFTLLMIAHQSMHLSEGDKPVLLDHLLDVVHHGLGLWVTYLAVRWAREAAQTAAQTVPVEATT